MTNTKTKCAGFLIKFGDEDYVSQHGLTRVRAVAAKVAFKSTQAAQAWLDERYSAFAQKRMRATVEAV